MKYGYQFCDWGLFTIAEIVEVKELEEDYILSGHIFKKEDYCIVRYSDKKYNYYVGGGDIDLFRKEYIFDTREEAEQYGREHSNCFS